MITLQTPVSNEPVLPASTTALEPIEAAKRLAAYAAVDNHVKKEHKVSTPPRCSALSFPELCQINRRG